MSHLTRAFLDYDAAVRLGLRDVYDWHQMAWRAFPNRDGAVREFLTRLDRRDRERQFQLLIVSAERPVRPSGWPGEGEAWQTREIQEGFFAHSRYRFQLRANPTKRENVSRKRIPLRTEAEQREWLQRKAEQSGFAVDPDSLLILPEGRERFRVEKRDQTGIHHAVEFEGVLTVKDAEDFRQVFAKGIGPAKSFGFGLLALVPLG